MNKALYLRDEFRPRGLSRDGSLVFSPDTALDLISEAEARRIRILGIDSYRISDTTWECLIDEQANYSRDQICAPDNWSVSRNFISDRMDRGFHFDVALGEAIEYKIKAEQDG
jgi:hypothetical protein